MKDVRRACGLKLAVVLFAGAWAACGEEAPSGGELGVLPVAGGSGVVPPTTIPPVMQPMAPMQPVQQPPMATERPGTAGAAAPPTAAPMTPPPVASDMLWCAVKRTLDTRCTACHNPQMVAGAPMSLMTYEELHAPAFSDKAKKVYELVGVRVHDTVDPMPPQEKLTAEQLAQIDQWVAAGAPAGSDPTCAANGPSKPTETPWPDHCDETYVVRAASMASPNTIAPGVETHPQIPVRAPWGSERVQAIGWRALTDNSKVLHHWILYGPSREFLFGWAPGKDVNEQLPPDVGVYLPAGNMTLDVHYNNSTGTQAERDASGVEICVLKEPNFRPKTATVTQGFSQYLINIPARAVDFEVTGTCTHSGSPVRILSASPHAHKTAHHMRFVVEKANGETIVMHEGTFNFEEQTTYAMKPPVVLEAGDRVITTCTFTNPTDRPVTFGEDTGNEMCFNFALYEPMGGLRCGVGGGFPRF